MSGLNKYYVLEKKRRGRSTATEAPIYEVLNQFMKKSHIDYNPYEDKIIEIFKEIVGTVVVNFITDIRLKGAILNVKVSLPSVKAELFMVRDAMKDSINRRLKKDVLKGIVIK
ncbi:MAG: DUF721 domain-containing protein [Bacteroidales bacterium]|nr:DUF721 domain-containing protein [Bacteroidales bacterium]